ncbi:type I restriction-modification system subunit M [Methanocalculus taiwanensis]|uniref:site-specific DNA-methyltransferase (adenine-specific) n=1 Tax=Methanocalculus taiwanensis TaxID=106207 RepID=A0ABD4TIR4_9EURY|nr:type I restriction-modification system subunit M [Methanocalculus taiwanensis]MCQ1537833.1 type I restriction-modification system subunit M [Methanocalculus taiwanensis]
MALKKTQLYSSLWQSCDELRGGMDASQYKDYILTLLFMKYVSDKSERDRSSVIKVPEGGSFSDMVRLKGDKEIGDKINKIIGKLAEANDLKGVIDLADFNDESKLGTGKEMQDRLSKLIAIFDSLDFSANGAEGDDLLGDAYEYLMRNFATESGKSKGQFYTPAEVSRIIAKVVGIGPDTRQDQTIYDPTCGSGSLLLKAAEEAPRGISIYGQEMDNATWSLARMNMFLHNNPTHEIWRGNTLSSPHYKNSDGGLKTFDFAVANPPFSSKAWTSGLKPEDDEFGRFDLGVPPSKNGDYAFLLHLIKSLKSSGKGAIILPHGVLFRGNKEGDIRRNLIKRGLIKGIIGLPANLFYGTGIPACIIVIDKENAHARTGIFMIDASKGYAKDGNKNRLRSQDIHKIVDVFNHQIDLPGYSRMVPVAEIADPANDYNLNIPRYIDASDPEDLHDLNAHMNGGIPNRDIDALEEYWAVFPSLRNELFKGNGRPGYSEPKIEAREVRGVILVHPEFKGYASRIAEIFREWRSSDEPLLNGLSPEHKTKEVIHTLSEDLLKRYANLPLLSRYDVYQRLMDYWAEVMQDDVGMIIADGWVEAARPRGIIEDKERKIKETPDLVVNRNKFKMDLVSPNLIVSRYFTDEQERIDHLRMEQEQAARELEEFIEENTGEEGLLEDAKGESGKITKGDLSQKLKEIGRDPEDADERDALKRCLALMDAESDATKAVKTAQAKLDAAVLAMYPKLNEDAIKVLVINDKWFASICSAIEGEVQQATQRLASRVKELDERYARPLPELEHEVEEYAAKVEEHLKRMGVEWG